MFVICLVNIFRIFFVVDGILNKIGFIKNLNKFIKINFFVFFCVGYFDY